MGTVSNFDKARLLDPAHARLNGQERVNAEIFTAMEILGRKLERSEAERDRLARRLSLIESVATMDEKTGKLYLPVVTDPAASLRTAHPPAAKWMLAASLMSGVIAFFALSVVLFHDPGTSLTKEQLAALEFLKSPQFAMVSPESKGWKHLESAGQDDAHVVAAAAVPVAKPAPVVLAKQEPPPAEILKSVDVPVMAAVAPKPPVEVAAKMASPAPVHAVVAAAAPVPAENAVMPPDTALPEKLAQLEKRAGQGVPEAQHDLATLYASGKMVAQNYPRAIYWFRKAADGGVANANYNLGVIYQQGLSVPPDMKQAVGWYEKAAELGHPEAAYNLGIAYIEGVGVKTNIEKGVSYFKRAANAGVAQAAYNLGVLYESNFLGAADTSTAIEWYRVAANEGHAQAQGAISRLQGGVANDQGLTLADMVEPASGGPSSSGILAKVRQELIRQRLLPDSTTGPQLEDAIRAYQKKLALPEDGKPSQEFLEKMQQAVPPPLTR